MSLFRYRITVQGGTPKEGSITAKTEEAARARLAKEHSIVEWHSIKAVPNTKPQSLIELRVPKAKPLSKLGKLLYLQSGKCFFCQQPLREEDASIEHLNPVSKGGSRTEDNEVVCHASLNATFGNMDLKRKFDFVVRQAGAFKCPPCH